MTALRNLFGDISNALNGPDKKLLVIFVDYKKAFDLLDRGKLLIKLETVLGHANPLLEIIRCILAFNYVTVNDNTALSNPILQRNGVLQGDPLSPLLFNVAISDLAGKMKEEMEDLKVYLYADDVAIASRCPEKLQMAFSKLMEWADENKFTVNRQKTVQMVFRKGGRIPARDIVHYENGEPLEITGSFKYLGITLQTSGTSYSRHIKERVAAGVRAMNEISMLNRLSVGVAMELFKLKISPIMTYGLDMIWEYLSKENLKDLESVKATYMKKVLCLSKFTLSRLCYELTREPFYTTELRHELLLPSTTAYVQLQEELQEKKKEIWQSFYSTDAMTNSDWMNTDYELRHITTRFATHGFHHLVCQNKTYHTPNEGCVCELCHRTCDRYHVMVCPERTGSLTAFCSN